MAENSDKSSDDGISELIPRLPKFKVPNLVVPEGSCTLSRVYGDIVDGAIGVLEAQFEDQAEFCDATIVVRGQELKAHWCVLVSCPYFEALYRNSLTGVKPDRINLDIVSKDIVKLAVKFLYSGQVLLTLEVIMDLVVVADFLQISKLKTSCFEFVDVCQSKLLTVENCVKVCWLAGMYGGECGEKLYKSTYKYICVNLSNVINQGDILNVPPDFIISIITDEKLSFIPSMQLFELIVKWTEFQEAERLEYFPNMLISLEDAIIRSHDSELKQVVSDHKFVRDSTDLSRFVRDLQPQNSSTSTKTCILVQNRTPRDLNCLYVIGENRWVNLKTPVYQRSTARSSTIFALSGDGSDTKLFTYDLAHDASEPVTTKSVSCTSINTIISLNSVGQAGQIFALQMKYDCAEVTLLRLNKMSGDFEPITPAVLRNAAMAIRHIVVSNRYICVLGMTSNTKRTIFANYSLSLRRVFSCHSPDVDVTKVLYMYERNNILVIGEQDSEFGHAFDFSMRGRKYWRPHKSYAIPQCPFGTILVDKSGGSGGTWSIVSHGDSLYGMLNPPVTDNTNKVAVATYNLNTRQWTQIEQNCGPSKVSYKLPCLMQIPAEALRCHYECPHCDALDDRKMHQYSFLDQDDSYDESDDIDDDGSVDFEDLFYPGCYSSDDDDDFIRRKMALQFFIG